MTTEKEHNMAITSTLDRPRLGVVIRSEHDGTVRGPIVKVEDIGHDTSMRYTCEDGYVFYATRWAKVSKSGLVIEPEWSKWASD